MFLIVHDDEPLFAVDVVECGECVDAHAVDGVAIGVATLGTDEAFGSVACEEDAIVVVVLERNKHAALFFAEFGRVQVSGSVDVKAVEAYVQAMALSIRVARVERVVKGGAAFAVANLQVSGCREVITASMGVELGNLLTTISSRPRLTVLSKDCVSLITVSWINVGKASRRGN
jgi:hypothetical protein